MLRKLKIRATAPTIQRYVVEIKIKSEVSPSDEYKYFGKMNEVKKFITELKKSNSLPTGSLISIFKISYTHNYSLMQT